MFIEMKHFPQLAYIVYFQDHKGKGIIPLNRKLANQECCNEWTIKARGLKTYSLRFIMKYEGIDLMYFAAFITKGSYFKGKKKMSAVYASNAVSMRFWFTLNHF